MTGIPDIFTRDNINCCNVLVHVEGNHSTVQFQDKLLKHKRPETQIDVETGDGWVNGRRIISLKHLEPH